MRVSDQIVPWNEGQAVLFDDSYEHETRNRTDHERVVLLFDVWHPELTLRERESIIDMFGSVASGEGGGA
jgi:aspartyl/asparaginyl beta-hydroxylase (cupin superfamily)